ncbi:MAG: site-specific integrase [Anaerolineales bacterium]|nr:site-specific integrase [Anaerolineales bacterium]
MSIKIRAKRISGGRSSLFLDIYLDKSRYWKEFLGIHCPSDPRTSVERDEVRLAWADAEFQASQRSIELRKDPRPAKRKQESTLAGYCREIMATKTGKTRQGWGWMIRHIELSGIGAHELSTITPSVCKRFRAHLVNNGLAQASQAKYFGLFMSALRDAHLDDIIPIDLRSRVDPVPRGNATKHFLTQAELDLLFSTPVRSVSTRTIFLFSCLTGMRHSDIKALKWSNAHETPEGVELRYKMKKTGKDHVLPISVQAVDIMGKRGKPGSPVFQPCPTIQSVNRVIHPWRTRAGITKPITFHSGRHTFATLALSAGTPLKVVSDYLGHSSVAQTEVYARLLDDERNRYVGRVVLTVPISIR